MTSLQLPEPEAHRRLQVEARRRNLKLAEVASTGGRAAKPDRAAGRLKRAAITHLGGSWL